MFTPTDEQLAIIDFAKNRPENLLISALAGAAKTTTLELICKALPSTPILSLAFNKRIADEMAKRLPGNVKAQTLNSVGHGVWMKACGRLTLNARKIQDTYKIVLERKPKALRRELQEYWQDVINAIRAARQSGYIPPNAFASVHHPVGRDEFFGALDEELPDFVCDLVDEILTTSIEQAYAGAIDFDDQIYMPTLFGGSFPKYPLVMIDEAQDLSFINHAMLKKLVSSRLIAVGDPNQSIYGFRGAVSSGMSSLRAQYSMVELKLSTSFRCPISHVKRAWQRVPYMRWPEWAKEGEIHEHEHWSLADIPDGAAVICRNNAPLFKLGFILLRSGRGIRLVGTDIGPQLVRALKKLGPETLPQSEVIQAIARWEAERLKKSRATGSVVDRADCLRVFAENGQTLGAIVAYAEHIFKQEGPIQLMSGHKAKGLEFDTVFHLDPWRIPSKWAEDTEQELNVLYVIETRAKHSLHTISMEGLISD